MEHVINLILSAIILPVTGFIGVKLLSVPTRKEVQDSALEVKAQLDGHDGAIRAEIVRRDETFRQDLLAHEARDNANQLRLELGLRALDEKLDHHFTTLFETLTRKG